MQYSIIDQCFNHNLYLQPYLQASHSYIFTSDPIPLGTRTLYTLFQVSVVEGPELRFLEWAEEVRERAPPF